MKVRADALKDWTGQPDPRQGRPRPPRPPARTGHNNLVAFSVGIWYQIDASATTYRQANDRHHRIGQARPVMPTPPVHATALQQTLLDLLSRKVGASLQVDGLDLQAALETACAGDAHSAALAIAMGMGQAIANARAR